MKEYRVRVYNFIEKFHDEYTVFATSKAQAKSKTMERIFIETDYETDEFEVLEIEEVK